VAEWQRVVFAWECDEFDNCPVCGTDYTDCPCPGPTMDEEEWEYLWRDGMLMARKRDDEQEP